MDQQISSAEISSLSSDELEMQEVRPTSTTTDSFESSSSSSAVYKTARDQFFEDLQRENDKDRWSAKCKLCKKSKIIIDKLGVTSNFTRHVKQYHKDEYNQWLNNSKKADLTGQKNKITNHLKKKYSPVGPSYGENHPRQVELSSAIVDDLIINLGLPLSIVEKPAFVNFMQKVDSKFAITSRRTLSRTTIPALYDQMNNRLKMFCSKAVFLSLALDIWSDRRKRSFFAITGLIFLQNIYTITFKRFLAHSIIDGDFKTYVLCFDSLWGSHSGPLLLEKYEEVVGKFRIKDKIIRLVTDSAANNISAFKNLVIPGFEDYFADENDGDTYNDDGALSDEYEYPPDNLSTTNSLVIDVSFEQHVEESFDRLTEHNEVFRIPCFAHTLQLVVNDGLKESTSIKCALEKVSAIAKLAHTTTKFAEKLESMNVSIPRAVVTRWNSQFTVVERILSISSITLNEILLELKHTHLCLNKRDLVVLQEFVGLLSLFAQATTVSQQQKSPSISFVAPSILEIYFDLLNDKKNLQYTTSLCEALLSSLCSRFGGLLEQMEINLTESDIRFQMNKKFYDLYKDPVFLFTPFLDGMFKLRWVTESSLPNSAKDRLCEKIKELIFDHCLIIERNELLYSGDASFTEASHQTTLAAPSSSTTPKRKYLFGNIESGLKNVKKAKPVVNHVNEEISRYIDDENNESMLLLNQIPYTPYKCLAKLAVKYLCIPATSAEVERTFSHSGYLLRPHRSRMSRKTLEQLTLLKCNNNKV
jgi:hypothetical protein